MSRTRSSWSPKQPTNYHHRRNYHQSTEDDVKGGRGGLNGNNNALEWRLCGRSGLIKPPRAHYDNVSGMIVLNMDHFCPWVANTIGYANYRYFLLMLFWTFVGCAYVVLMLTPRVYYYGIGSKLYILVIYVTAFSFSVVLTMFLAFHSFLISTGQTTIDFWMNLRQRAIAKRQKTNTPWENPFDLGMRRNWEQVFGRVHWSRAILPSLRRPPWPPYATKQDFDNEQVEFYDHDHPHKIV
mmetsp:Transcript_31372/g.50943  ORF Transcript_31372/g.50943 Transcript_31372/m.50943 type:complete len:239 (+) Transcript_31372:169-885(+)